MSKQQHDKDEQRASSSDAGQSQPATENSVPRPAQAAHEKTRDESGKASSSKDSRPRSRGRRGGKPSHQDRSSQLEKTGSPLSGQSDDVLDAFETAIRRVPDVLECHLMAGSADYLLKIVAEDTEDFARIHRQYLTRLPHVTRMQSSVALRTVSSTTALPL